MKQKAAPRIAWISLLLVGLLAAVPSARALYVDDIIELKRAGVSEETIMRVIDDARAVFRLSVDDILDLKDAGCSDDLIRALMDTPELYGARRDDDFDYDEYQLYYDDYDYSSIYDDDDYTNVFVHYYYDPFAYHWYVWPSLYYYHSPFWWTRAGFYWGGHWCWDWWDPWGPCTYYCDWRWGYHRYHGDSRTRLAVHRNWHPEGRGATARRLHRESNLYRRAGLDLPESHRAGLRPEITRTSTARTARAAGSAGDVTRRSLRSDRLTVRSPAARELRSGSSSRDASGRTTYRRPQVSSRDATPAPQRGSSRIERGSRSPTPRSAPSISNRPSSSSGRSSGRSIERSGSSRSSSSRSSGSSISRGSSSPRSSGSTTRGSSSSRSSSRSSRR